MSALVLRVLGALAVAGLLWWAVGHPRVQLHAERAAHAETRSEIAGIKAQLEAADARAAQSAADTREAVAEALAREKSRQQEAINDAYERGRSTAAGIQSGAVRVRTVWRDRECPATAAGEGAEPAGGDRPVPAGRAAAVGDVLGAGGEFDARYRAVYRRLQTAQHVIDQCFEEPAP